MSEIIAKAMNSTMGSSKFVAFDKLIHYKRVNPSDENLFIILPEECEECNVSGNYNGTGESSTRWANGVAISFKISTLTGRINIKFSVNTTVIGSAKGQRTVLGVVGLHKKDVMIKQISGCDASFNHTESSAGTPYTETHEITFTDVKVTPGDSFWISFTLSTNAPQSDDTGSIAVSSNIEINGTLSDYVDFEIL